MEANIKQKTLRLIVTEEWFDKIWEGSKSEDFREIKPYWKSRLIESESALLGYDFVEVTNGYGSGRPTMVFKWNGFRTTDKTEETDLGIGRFFAIDLSEFVESINVLSQNIVEKTAEKEYICSAFEFINNADLEIDSLVFSDKKRLVLTRKSKGIISKGQKYVKGRGQCSDSERWIYRALPHSHEFNMNNNMYSDVC